ncbi:TonB family protein [Thermomonas carbonis]|uniref:TonB family protein n=1 Tax=Thermomonas carbonis TaxID=1463158 RepID=A0A7G9SQB9_9GAMM|nr:TonB family protein [Thermomonas carbonis]QNN70044.1 TonB family protein [Thermomonas carbonis]GHB97323.1 hypothetical protein GCM10010080_06770 [Thermomonas carbonis]
MSTKQWARWILGMSALATLAAAAGQPQQAKVYTFQVELDERGALLSATPLRDAADATTTQLQQALRDWVFRPAQRDGTPIRTTTWVRVTAIPGEGTDSAQVLSATAGPAPDSLRKPAFPVAAQVRGQQGVIVLQIDMDAQGRVRAVDVHDTVGGVNLAMANAAMAAARDWTFRPERVNGEPQAGRLLMPVCFVSSSNKQACAWTGPDAQAFGRDTVLALDPAVRLERVAYAGR